MRPARSRLALLSSIVSSLSALVAVPIAAETRSVPFDDPAWKIEADSHEIVEYEGRPALHLQGGRAWLPGVDVENGIVEFDIAFGPERGFSGGLFRMVAPDDYEHFYLRPHQSGYPDASQYTPVVQGVSGWQLYHSPAFAAPFEYRFGEWMHVTITFSGSRAVVDVDGAKLFVPRLKRPTIGNAVGGAVGVNSGFAPAYFSGFRYSSGVPADSALSGDTEFEAHLPELPATLVRDWRVSEAFSTGDRPSGSLDDAFRDGLAWRDMTVEPEGFVNLAWADGVSGGKRAVLAEITIEAEAAGHRLVRFGYSDLVRVFVNGVEVYRGSNLYRSRDYRYLGTIGLFDVVVAPVRAGKNTVTFVVAESFGGWGVMAAVDPLPSD